MKRLLFFSFVLFSIPCLSQMTTVGVANQMGGCSTYQLTTPANNIAGAIWTQTPIDLSNDFDMTFQLWFGNDGIWGADGMAFVLQQNSTGIGFLGNALGYADPNGSPPLSASRLALELDIFDNGGAVPTDVAEDHMAFSSNGSQHHNLVAPVTFPGNQVITDGNWHEFRVEWIAGTTTMRAYWEGNAAPMITLTNDIVNTIFGGNPIVYWGFTGATGGLYNETRVRVVSSPAITASPTSICPGLPVSFTDLTTSPTGQVVTWSWDFGDGSPLDNNQNPTHSYNAPGVYNVVLTVSDGFCDTTVSTSITVLDSITMNMTATDVTCFGDTDGQAMSTPTNGSGPYNYLWNDGGSQTTQTATSLPPGWYTVEVTDNLGCVGYDSVEVQEPLEMTLTMDSTDASCNGGVDGTATATPVNGTPTYNYTWNDGGSQTTQTATGLAAGVYTVVVIDSDGCTATDSVEVVEAAGLTVNMDSIPPTCNGGSDGAAIVVVTSGVGPFTYLWDDAGAQTTDTAFALPAGQYAVTVTGGAGCNVTDTVVVTQPAAIIVLATPTDADCYQDSTGSVGANVTNGTAPYTFLWDDPSAQTTQTATNLPAGSYNVVVTDVNGCTGNGGATIGEPTELTGTISATDDFGSGGSVEVTVSGGTTPYTYLWDSGETTEDLSGMPAGTYEIIVTDDNGCTLTMSDTIDQILDLDFPTALTPNGDGFNDTYEIIGIEAYPDNKFTITNRWGNMVFSEDNYSNGWDGTNMNGDPLPEGVYFMVFESGVEQHTRYVELKRQ